MCGVCHVRQAGLFKTTSETFNSILKTQGVGGFYVGYFTTVSSPLLLPPNLPPLPLTSAELS